MRILVAGGAGYIGSALVPALLERGHEVDVADLLWFGNHLPAGVRVLQKDVMALTEAELAGYQQVIYLAGLSNDPMAEYSPARNFVENGAATSYLAYIAKRAGVTRFIYGGSCSVYGYTVNELFDETSPAVSSYPYGISKLQGEFGALQLHDDSFSVICFRQGTVGGYSPRMRLDLIVNTMFKCAVDEGVITVNNPAIWRPLLAIQDAVHGYTLAVDAKHEVSGVFNIASGNFTVGDVAESVRAAVHRTMGIEARIVTKHVHDMRNYKVSSDKARTVLGFSPRYDIERIVEELVENLAAFRPFDAERFYNIKVFKSLYPELAPRA